MRKSKLELGALFRMFKMASLWESPTHLEQMSLPGSPANCVILSADNSVHALTLISEAQSGLKIPSGQIAGRNFTIGAGETKDLDIDFNACASIVPTGSGKFMLKPVLHAGEVGLSSAINGTVIDSTTDKPIVGGTTVVALEQKDGGGVDRVILSTLTDAKGNFALCPVPAGSYDLVVAAVNGVGIFYAATVTTGVQASCALRVGAPGKPIGYFVINDVKP